MKIRILTRYPWSLGYGGAEIQAKNYVEYGKKRGIDIDFLDNYTTSANYDILHLIGLDYNSYQISNYAKAKNIKIVISPVYYTTPFKAAVIAMYLRIFRNKHFASLHLMKMAIELSDCILPNSYEEQKQLLKVFGLRGKQDSFSIIYNGVEKQSIETISSDKFRNCFGVEGDYILSVSMIDRRKNNVKLIEGYLESGSESTLVIIGDIRGHDHDYIEKFRSLVENNKKKIKHIPLITDKSLIYSAYSGAKLHAMPSILETPGLSNLEAASFGCNLIVGDCAPVREYFGDLPFYVQPKNVSSIAEGIIVAEKKDRSSQIDTISNFYWDNIIDDLIKVYENVLQF